MRFGFPTGKLSGMTLADALARNVKFGIDAVEISALRFEECEGILQQFEKLELPDKMTCTFHAPSRFRPAAEQWLVNKLVKLPRECPVVLHPDTISNYTSWRRLGSRLRIENMDLRKQFGQTVEDLLEVFKKLPEARFCFDVGHARQIDPALDLTVDLFDAFEERIDEIHMSVVQPSGQHACMTYGAMDDYGTFLKERDHVDTVVILEVPLDEKTMADDLKLAKMSFT